MNTLRSVLLRPITDNARTRAYQAGMDQDIDAVKRKWDIERGLVGAAGVAMPHETVADFWEMTADEQARHITPAQAEIYELNRGRVGTAVLCQAAFCWYSPLSRHRGDPQLKRFFENGVHFHLASVRADGLMGAFGFNGEGWAHGWDIEGLIYGMVFLGDAIDPALFAFAKKQMAVCAERMMNFPRVPSIIGSFGNQRCVFTLGLYLYGHLLNEPRYIAESDRYWQDAMVNVLDHSGQVIEQMGPCLHYSHTAFIYAWLNLVVRNDTTQLPRVVRCLQWFRDRLTASQYPFAGPTTRSYVETMGQRVQDLCPAIEQVAHLDPTLMNFIDRAMWRMMHQTGPLSAKPADEPGTLHLTNSHAASTAMWSILMAQPNAQPAESLGAGYNQPVMRCHDATQLLKRSPMKYVIVRRKYQTNFSFTDFMPFSGIQTWAWGDEPPIVHPTPLAPSTTQGDRLDTAKQGTSHNWGGYGAGAVGIDGYIHDRNENGDDNELPLLVARYDWLFRVALFTDSSTVILELGDGGPRRTLWTLNRTEPAEPTISPREANIVRFAERVGTLHASVNTPPAIVTLDVQNEWATGVKQLRYDIPNGVAAFGLSNGSLRFQPTAAGAILDGSVFRFADDTGSYEVTLNEGLLKKPNPGNFSIDTFELAKGTIVKAR